MGASWLFSQQPSATKFAAAAAPGKQSKPARTVVAEEEEAEVDTISQTFAVNLNISEVVKRAISLERPKTINLADDSTARQDRH